MVHLMWLFYGYGLCVPMKSTRPWGVPFGCNLWFIREPLFTPLMHPWCALLWSLHAIVHVTLHHSVRNQQGQRMPFGIGPKLSEVKWSQIVSVVLNGHKLNNIFLRCPFEFQISFQTDLRAQAASSQFGAIIPTTRKLAQVCFSLRQSASICADRDRQLSCITECNCYRSLHLDG